MADRAKWSRRLQTAGWVLVLAWAAAALWLDRWGAQHTVAQQTHDAIIVLGCRVDADGRASTCLRARAERAADLFHAGVAPRIVTTGGLGDNTVCEADAAAEVLLAHGVPTSAIVRESTSSSTEQNAERTAELLGPTSVVIVSDGYHLLRASRVFARRFVDVDVVAADAHEPSARWFGAMREVVALLAYAAAGRL